jgi:5,6-dimethylbenzimidazole synthase
VAAFAGALGVRLGGQNAYHGRTERRGAVKDGGPPDAADLARVRLSGWSARRPRRCRCHRAHSLQGEETLTQEKDVFGPGGHAPGEDARPPAAPAMPPADVEALYQVVAGRRDIRNGFLPDPIADDVLTRVLTAAHQAPSVGLSQPWDFIVLRDRAAREQAHALARRQQEVFAAGLPGPRARAFRELKVEAILDTPVNIVVTCDSTRGGRHVLGRHAQPQVAAYSTACAVQNFWLAARPGASVWAGSASSTSGAGRRARPARPPAGGRYLCGTSRRSRPRRNWRRPAGPGARAGPGPPAAGSGRAGGGRARRPPAWSPTPSPRSGRWTPRPWRRPASGRRR